LLTPEFISTVDGSTYGSKMPRANWEFIGNLPIAYPSLPEQRLVADFLDCEVGKIDNLLHRQTDLLARLEESRVAMIARAVTKGLPPHEAVAAGFQPNAVLKNTGVDWLGEVPKHWSVLRLKWAIRFQRGHDLPFEMREEGNVPVVTSAGITSKHSIAAARAPGIVTGRYGSIGEFYLIEEDYWPLNTTLYSNSLRGNDPRFLVRMLANLAPLFLLNAVKSAVPGVDRNDIHPVLTAVPPVAEQRVIANYIDLEEARILAVASKTREAIERIREYRSVLISAAVTGKIDVRKCRQQEIPADCLAN
jgi:type I restriction enzyme S subunit